ncbi:MAG: bifunctional alpha,alpha-trehalose-phosphate synthase (UDP-forming)/trehalose-phosphatase [Candidatus Aminicenantes bacterium]|nr:bifunctional alpha,alpha-trehalose-phosphate synthase (UDP-forming)/trehalose-phosphatase [Candidatus Aminicenantes bacterium]
MARLLIVSNRMPVTIFKESGNYNFQQSAGGLATGLKSFLKHQEKLPGFKLDYLWVGWPGISVNEKKETDVLKKRLLKLKYWPVFLSETEMENFYHGFCNRTIWPLFHYFTSYVEYEKDFWHHFKKVNRIFSEALLEIIREDDTIWIHDYHLMLLPQLIREKFPKAKIGFFLHIPFPTFEIFRLLPGEWRQEILRGMLGSDLIGFHTNDYTQYFLRCALRILGLEHDMGRIMLEDRLVQVETFPMGIDFQSFHESAKSALVKKERGRLKKEFKKTKTILSIDRLDYSKGILNRLQGFELFLEQNPGWREKTQLVMIVVPSRAGVTHYLRTKKQIDETVGKINGKYATLTWTPILYQFRSLDFPSLVALYSQCQVALVTPLRDGMNLVAKEYVASKSADAGVLILSEKAGAAEELGEAIVINPFYIEEIAAAIKEALEIPQDEQLKRLKAMQGRLRRYDIFRWAKDFLLHLNLIKETQKKVVTRILDGYRESLLVHYRKAKKRLVYLDYDGTLVPIVKHYSQAAPDQEILKLLKNLSARQNNQLVIVTGRDRKTISDWLKVENCSFIAEHGAWIKERDGDWIQTKALDAEWKAQILPILDIYSDRLPGSFIEEKEFSLTWHFRNADPELGMLRAKELMDYLISFTANKDLQVLQGKKVVEIRNAGINKGLAAAHWLAKKEFDFILAAGDDWTDEDLFKVLPETAYSIKVGLSSSLARFNVINYKEIRKLLEELNKN